MANNPVICAIDTSDFSQAKELVNKLSSKVGMVKLGLEFFTAFGRDGVKEIVDLGVPVFLDLKLHDIPNTVAKSVRNISDLGVSMLTVHSFGGKEMIKAAVNEAVGKTDILAVTILTSMADSDLEDIGSTYASSIEHVVHLATLAEQSGAQGIVCSANELEAVKKNLHNEMKLVVPGIRPEGSDVGDQKRVMTPAEAIKKGADYLVIGRPITNSSDPLKATEDILESI